MDSTPAFPSLHALVEAARRVGERGLCVSTSGNASARLEDGRFAISMTGAQLRTLSREHLAVCELEDGAHVSGPRPSREAPFHRAIYRARPDVRAVLHTQSPYATALACEGVREIDLDFIPEIPVYLGEIAFVTFELPATDALGEAVARALKPQERTAALLENHGQITVGATPAEALQRAEFLEFACRIRAIGGLLQRYDEDTVAELRAYRMK